MTGQVLRKASNADQVTVWADLTSSDVGLGNVTDDAQLKASQLSTDGTLTADSDTLVPSQKAVKTYVDTTIAIDTPDATPSIKGKIQLAGDISGTAASPTVVSTHLTSALPIIQGGTGSITQNFVSLAGDLGNTVTSPLSKARTYAATIAPSGSVADYVCTGTADDVQIQAAITAVAAAGGGVIFVRRGTYRISATITFPLNANVWIVGEKWAKQGTGGTIFKTSAGSTLTDMFKIAGNTNPTTNADLNHDNGFFNCTFDGNSTTTNDIKLSNQDTFHLENCRVVGSTNGIATVWDSSSDPIVATVPGGLFIRGCIISANSGIGIDLQYQTQVWITDCWFSGNSVTTWMNIKSCNKIHTQNLEFDSTTTSVAFSDTATVATADVTLNGCTFVQASGNAWTEARTNAGSERVFITGTILPGITHDKLVGTHNTVWLSDGMEPVTIQSQAVGDTPLILKGIASQSGRYFQVQNSSGTQLLFINNTGSIFVANGSATTPGISFANDVGSGIYRISSAVLGLSISGTQVGQLDANGLSSIRISPRVSTLTVSSNTYTIPGDTTDLAIITTTPTANFTMAAPTGTPVDGQLLRLRILSGSTGYAPTWNTIFVSSGIATLPTTALPASKTVTFGFSYNAASSKWVLLAADTTGY